MDKRWLQEHKKNLDLIRDLAYLRGYWVGYKDHAEGKSPSRGNCEGDRGIPETYCGSCGVELKPYDVEGTPVGGKSICGNCA